MLAQWSSFFAIDANDQASEDREDCLDSLSYYICVAIMDETQYYADSPPTTVNLAIEPHFDALTDKQKLYAHHISRSVTILYLPAAVT